MFFSGFCFEGEKEFFSDILVENNYTISGFSYGAIKAIDTAYEMVKDKKRVDLIQLFSPAYFEDTDDKFKRLQLMFFQKDPNSYADTFLENTIYPNKEIKSDLLKYFKMGTKEQLNELLYHKCNFDKIDAIKEHNIKIEVYLGGKDKIINSSKAKDLYKDFAEVYFIKDVGHSLR